MFPIRVPAGGNNKEIKFTLDHMRKMRYNKHVERSDFMYSEKLKSIQYDKCTFASNGATYGSGLTEKKLKSMIEGFCRPEDLVGLKHADIYRLFDDYCKENGYPIVNRQTLGKGFTNFFNLERKKVRIDGKLEWIYVIKGTYDD